MRDQQYYLYIVTNRHNTVLYTGVTSDLAARVSHHRQGLGEGFTSSYRARKLVYYEVFDDPEGANQREKQIKAGSRRKKVELIESVNPAWEDLYAQIEAESD